MENSIYGVIGLLAIVIIVFGWLLPYFSKLNYLRHKQEIADINNIANMRTQIRKNEFAENEHKIREKHKRNKEERMINNIKTDISGARTKLSALRNKIAAGSKLSELEANEMKELPIMIDVMIEEIGSDYELY